MSASFAILLTSTFQVRAEQKAAAGTVGEGFKILDSAGDTNKALEIFNAAARKNPASADAHYGRARALSSLGRHEEAVKEFKLTILLEPNGEAARKSKEKLGGSGRKDAVQMPANAAPPGTVQAKDVESSINKILSQSEERIKSIHSGSESYANNIFNSRSSALNRAMEQAKQEAEQERMRYRRGRRGIFNNDADIRERQQEIQYRYQSQMSRAKSDFEARRGEAEKRAMGIKDSAEGLESQMVNKPSETSGVFLMPTGTNLYVRNYGHFDPVLPEPPEPLHAVPLKLPQVLKMQEEAARDASKQKKEKRQ